METYNIDNILIYRSVYKYIDSNMYLIINNYSALIIDPHYCISLSNVLSENNVSDVTIILTHEHPDHISGVMYLANNFNITLICQHNCAISLSDIKKNRPILLRFLLSKYDRDYGTSICKEFDKEYNIFSYNADIVFNINHKMQWNDYLLYFYHTPGHSPGSCCIMLNNIILFSGDTLLDIYPIIVRFPGGSIEDYMNITIPKLNNLFLTNKDMTVFPGHGLPFCINKLFNGDKIDVEFQ